MKKQLNYVYPSWYWLWNSRVRLTLRAAIVVLLLLILFGFTRELWLLNLLLLPAFFLLAAIGANEKFERGYVPSMIRKRMLNQFQSKLIARYEAFYVLKRAYKLAATIAPKTPQDSWLHKGYFVQAMTELSRTEQDNPNVYKELCSYIVNRYY